MNEFQTPPNYSTITNLNGMPSNILSQDGKLRIDFLGWDEPNNGRMLWKVDVRFDGHLLNETVFENGWNYLNERIEQLDLEDDTANFYFVPVEGKAKLIQKSLFKVMDLPYKGISTVKFISNHFGFNQLLLVYSDELTLISLSTFESAKFDDHFSSIVNAEIISENEVKLKYAETVKGERIIRERNLVIAEDFKLK